MMNMIVEGFVTNSEAKGLSTSKDVRGEIIEREGNGSIAEEEIIGVEEVEEIRTGTAKEDRIMADREETVKGVMGRSVHR